MAAELANGVLQPYFGIQARHEPAVHFHSKKELPLLPFREFGNECGVVAVNLIL